jgi:hypothetical protein
MGEPQDVHPAIVRSSNLAVEALTGPDHGHIQHDFLIKAGVLIRRSSLTVTSAAAARYPIVRSPQ